MMKIRNTTFVGRAWRLRHCVGTVALSSVLAACYSNGPVNALTPPQGTTVQLKLTDRGSVDLAPVLGPRAEVIRGRVTDSSPDTLRLALSEVTTQSGITSTWHGEGVSVPQQNIAAITQRKFSGLRTGLLVAPPSPRRSRSAWPQPAAELVEVAATAARNTVNRRLRTPKPLRTGATTPN